MEHPADTSGVTHLSDEDRWQLIWDIFHGALEQTARQRAAYLATACRGDDTLRGEILSLLAEHEGSGDLLDRGFPKGTSEGLPRSVDPAGGQPARDLPDSHIGQRYQLVNVLGSGGMGEVYRTIDRLTGRVVALKKILSSPAVPGTRARFTSARTLTAPVAEVSVAEVSVAEDVGRELALAREFRLLACLRHPHIISVLDYGFDTGFQPYFTMPLLEDAETVLKAAAGAPFDVQVDFLSRILQALEYLHRQGVIHRDLKPNNVLVSDGRLKLLDFGISILRTETERAAALAGTLPYMAPETLTGEPSSAAADLFAVGVIAYELLAGRRPFADSSPPALLNRGEPVDLEGLPAPPAVRAVLARLLAPSPEGRYASASQALAELCRAAGRPPPAASGAIRDSFLQAARFVGRDAELAGLTQHLADATAGHGGVRLIAGESGVGKSRLLEELRTLALVDGILVVRGQAVRHGGSPYQVWRNVVRRLVLGCRLSDFEAGVLASLVPDLGELLGRPVAAAPQLEPRAARDRLLTVVEELFRRQRSTVLVILEDLHWADSESHKLLARLGRAAAEQPLLILGSYRDDELPEPPPSLAAVSVECLARLDRDAVGELCRSMLGEERTRPELVALLARETEGNAFFLVEAVRALADEAGGLERISTEALPEQIVTGGIRRVVRHRLERVPRQARGLLRPAAVAGRQLDLEVLRALTPGAELEEQLAACAAASVLEIEDGVWQFQHDKLREGILEEILPAELPELHRRVALAVESLPAAAAAGSAALAHHWSMAGDGERARHAAERAGREALASGAHEETIRWLRKAVELHRRHGATRGHLGSLERLLATAYHGLGRLSACGDHLRRSLSLLGWPAPTAPAGLGAGLLGQVLRQTVHRLTPRRLTRDRRRGRRRRARRIEAARAYTMLAEICYFAGDTLPLVHAIFRALNLVESAVSPASREPEDAAGGRALLASVHGAAAALLGMILSPLGTFYARRARAMLRPEEHHPDAAFTWLTTGGFHFGMGALAEAAASLRRGAELYQRLGDERRWEQITAWRAGVAELRGDFELCRELALALRASSERRGDAQTCSFALTYLAATALLRGAPEQAVERCREALVCLQGNIDAAEEKRARGLLALAHLRCGDLESARLEVAAAARLIDSSPPTVPHSLAAYASVAEVTLTLWREVPRKSAGAGGEGDRQQRRQMALAARRAVRGVERYARAFPVGRPRARLLRGRLARLEGRPRAARRAGREALRTARRLAMPLEEALAHAQLGRHLDPGDPAREAHLEQAVRLFEKLGVVPGVWTVAPKGRDRNRSTRR